MAKVPEIVELDSGVTVEIKPVPPRLYAALVENYEKRRPRPVPPLVEVKYKGEEPELQPNEGDPVYREGLAAWQRGLDARLQDYFMENAVRVDVPRSWRGEGLREAGVKVPRPRSRLERLLGLRKKADGARARLYLDYVALQSFDDIRRLNEGILSAAGLYTGEMLGDAEDSFRGRGGRQGAGEVGHAEQRGPRTVDLHRSQGGGDDGPQVPGGVGTLERAGEGAGGGVLPHQDEIGYGDRRARRKKGQIEEPGEAEAALEMDY